MKIKIFLVTFLIFIACVQPQAPAETNKTSASMAKNLEVCAILTKEDLAAIVGEPIAEAKKGEFPAGHPKVKVAQCTYKASKGAKALDVLIKDSSRAADSPESIKKLMMDMGSKIEEVPGVADTAFWSDSQLHAFKGKNLLVLVSVMGFQDPKDKSIKVAKFVLTKIKE
jgi:hypothetical protein